MKLIKLGSGTRINIDLIERVTENQYTGFVIHMVSGHNVAVQSDYNEFIEALEAAILPQPTE
jgi:uncharacterized protein YlzI (FlbEa/FlbD family)